MGLVECVFQLFQLEIGESRPVYYYYYFMLANQFDEHRHIYHFINFTDIFFVFVSVVRDYQMFDVVAS